MEITLRLHTINGKNPNNIPIKKILFLKIPVFFKKGIKAIKGINTKYVFIINPNPIQKPE